MSIPDVVTHPDIQGLVFRGYPALPHAAYGLFRIEDRQAFQALLDRLIKAEQITTAAMGNVKADETSRLNLAFTAPGLETLLGEGFVAESFEPAFVEGMVQEQRSRLLGDVEANDRALWRWGQQVNFDGMLLAFAKTPDAAEALLAQHLSAANGAVLVHTLKGNIPSDGKEAFGFADGISQPIIEGTPRHYQVNRERPREVELNGIPPGEIVLGYEDGTGKLPRAPAVAATSDPQGFLKRHHEWPDRKNLDENGTFLVFRQLAQHKDAFWDYLNEVANANVGETAQELAEKMVGRRMDGTSMEPTPRGRPNNNEFDLA
jgi:deferrochelatase/peroxidase EfeB